MRYQGKSFREVALELECSPSTVLREERRNAAPRQLRRQMSSLDKARYAEEKAYKRQREKIRRRGCALDHHAEARVRIVDLLLQTNYSPEAIAKIISQSDLGIKISGKSLRRWVKKHYPAYQKHFPHRGKRRRTHLTPRRRKHRQAAPEKRSVHERPLVANQRLRAGDLELDMIVCSQSKNAILSVRDRKTRHAWLELTDNLEAQTVRQAIIKVVHRIPPALRHTCTFDRGSEFAEVAQLEQFFGMVSYFCDAYAAWQKGSVENQNKEVRRHLPKGTDLATVSREQLDRIELLLNAKPRDCLDGISAGDAWFFELRRARQTLH